ncbi:MAG: hypothetical protein EBZ53_03855 [Verrucomicrobia bacterium]|nr:hypothetical protein [Verrucomicrobiota bacterium]
MGEVTEKGKEIHPPFLVLEVPPFWIRFLLMPEISSSQLTGPQADSFRKAKDAVSRQNWDYILMLVPPILETHPGFLEGRKVLRAAQIAKTKGASALEKGMAGVKVAPFLLQAKAAAGKSLGSAFAKIEEALGIDPTNAQANGTLAEIALANDLPGTAIFAHETVRLARPQDTGNLHGLARAYIAAKQMSKARDTYQRSPSPLNQPARWSKPPKPSPTNSVVCTPSSRKSPKISISPSRLPSFVSSRDLSTTPCNGSSLPTT